MIAVAFNASRIAATPRAGTRAAARPARVAVAARASVGSDGAVVFTSADFAAGPTVAVAEREEAVEEVANEVAEALTPESIAEEAADPVPRPRPRRGEDPHPGTRGIALIFRACHVRQPPRCRDHQRPRRNAGLRERRLRGADDAHDAL